jgi:hypothetical protein
MEEIDFSFKMGIMGDSSEERFSTEKGQKIDILWVEKAVYVYWLDKQNSVRKRR